MIEGAAKPDLLLDVTRLIWRKWRGKLPTGIDRVALAYLDHYADRACAVIQRKGLFLLFAPMASKELFDILADAQPVSRRRLTLFFVRHSVGAALRRPKAGTVYLNVGHTGLNDPALAAWLALRNLQAIYLVHDLIPLTHPETCRPGEPARHRQRMLTVLESAAGVIANSQATLDDLAAFAAAEGRFLPPALVAWIAGPPLRLDPAAARTSDRPYFVVLGTIEARKNHLLLLAVWRQLLGRLGPATPRLLIIGHRGWEADTVFAQLDALGPLSGLVEELPSCPDDQMIALIAGAQALLMPSLAEGYGLPVFEALGLGTPVIAANLSVYREVAGDKVVYRAPDDVDGWTAAVETWAAPTEAWRAEKKRIADFAPPTWSEHFNLVDKWLNGLVDDLAPVEQTSRFSIGAEPK